MSPTVLYVIILGVIFFALIVGFSYYLWQNYKKEKKYNNDALPTLNDLTPEDLVRVVGYSGDNTALPSMSEIVESTMKEQTISQESGGVDKKDNNKQSKEEKVAFPIVNPFDL